MRLSSNYLFHYTRSADVLKKILQRGFRFNLVTESIPYKKSINDNFMICFCDIKIEQAHEHRNCYGNFAIVLTKEWGINNGVSPVRYIHRGSLGVTDGYIKMKSRFREIREIPSLPGNELNTVTVNYLLFSSLIDSGDYNYELMDDFYASDPLAQEKMEAFEKEFKVYLSELNNHKLKVRLEKYLSSLGRRVIELHEELEFRDSYLRIYDDEFKCPASGKTGNKIFYDEKEWRAIKYIDTAELAKRPDLREKARQVGYLPDEFNLVFGKKDVVAILVENSSIRDEVGEFIKSENTLLTNQWSVNQVYLIDEFKE